jgi:hypothetical protein
MNRHLRPVAAVCICTAVLLGVDLFAYQPRAVATPIANLQQHSSIVAMPPTTIASIRPPVPLLVTPHTAFFVEGEVQPENTTPAIVTESQEGINVLATWAQAMIEADGYRDVSALVKAPDGTWTGLAMRGKSQVAVGVAADGRVSVQ